MFKLQIVAWLNQALAQTAKNYSKEFNEEIIVSSSKSDEHGDYSCNVAMILAKKWSMSPIKIAEAILKAARPNLVARVWIAGPGFINVEINKKYIAESFNENIFREGVSQKKIVIDYSAPNLAKALHVGHIRSSILGDALVRINSFLGNTVIKQNHVGDWGTQFGMILAYLAEKNISIDSLSDNIGELEVIYQSAKKLFDESEAFANTARAYVVRLQSKEPKTILMWQKFLAVSLKHCHDLYKRLGLLLELSDVVGESFYQDQLSNLMQDLKASGLTSESDGACCYFSESEVDKEGRPMPVILQKKDGGYLYATTDLAAVKYRTQVLKADKVIYVVDQRQALHFKMVYELAAKCAWYVPDCLLEHVGFGTINDSNGKPFKTRAGGTIKLEALIDEAVARAMILVQSKQNDINKQELEQLANDLAIASIKYNDLSKIRTSDYSFSYDHMLKFEGNTAPYILYAYVRLSKLAEQHVGMNSSFKSEIELKIAKHILTLGEVLQQTAEESMPHLLCNFIYQLAVLAMKFYETCPINNSEQQLRYERQNMAYMIVRTIDLGLSLLGINTISKM